MAGVIGDRYSLEEEAAKGAMGTVFRAIDLHTKKAVAVKILHRGDVFSTERFVREGALLAELSHPRIVQYIDHGMVDGMHFLVMEWIAGETLNARLAREGVSPADAVELTAKVADALAAAHSRGIVHRDLKPSNVMLARGDLADPRLVDFGIARHQDAAYELTQTGAM
jgi:serine/threonine protein kinase